MAFAGSSKSIYQTIAAVGPCPCDECDKAPRCGDLELACRDFSAYYATGMLVNMDRNPTRRQFQNIYRGVDD